MIPKHAQLFYFKYFQLCGPHRLVSYNNAFVEFGMRHFNVNAFAELDSFSTHTLAGFCMVMITDAILVIKVVNGATVVVASPFIGRVALVCGRDTQHFNAESVGVTC